MGPSLYLEDVPEIPDHLVLDFTPHFQKYVTHEEYNAKEPSRRSSCLEDVPEHPVGDSQTDTQTDKETHIVTYCSDRD